MRELWDCYDNAFQKVKEKKLELFSTARMEWLFFDVESTLLNEEKPDYEVHDLKEVLTLFE